MNLLAKLFQNESVPAYHTVKTNSKYQHVMASGATVARRFIPGTDVFPRVFGRLKYSVHISRLLCFPYSKKLGGQNKEKYSLFVSTERSPHINITSRTTGVHL
jgi:hypothetical protein